MSEEKGRGGYARLASVVHRERAKGGNLVYVHAGDALSPCLFCGLDQGAHLMALTNMVSPDVFVPGNHEFDFGKDVFLKRMGEARFPLFAANLRGPDGAEIKGFRDSELRQYGSLKVGIIGATAQDSHEKSSPGDLKITATVEAVKAEARTLRAAGADLVVAVVHAARPIDNALIESRAVDVILSGDDHDLHVTYDGRVAFAESGADARVVTAVRLSIDIDKKDGERTVTWWPDFRIIVTADVMPDPIVLARVKAYEAELSAELDSEIGEVVTPLDTRTASVRTQETTFGDLVADAVKAATGADASIVNGGGIRFNRVYPAGHKLSRRDILNELPFGNTTVMIEITGAGLLAALENGVSRLPDPSGRFPQIAGMTVEVDLKRPPGNRVVAVMVGAEPLRSDRRYKLATNDFMLRGSEGYAMFQAGRVLIRPEDGALVANDVMVLVRKLGKVEINGAKRMVVK
jgi:2',3'-cyclic-nucleotide 2'-phosphodiesterase (5'-nucleotidase family)